MVCRIGQQRDELEHFHKRTGPSMSKEKRNRVRTLSTFVDEMNPQTACRSLVVCEGIDPLLLRPPVEFGKPIICEFLHILKARAITPVSILNFIRPTSSRKAL